MFLIDLPGEIWEEILKGFVATDLITLWHNVPPLRYLVTPDRLKIASNKIKVKENYDLPDEFYLIEETIKKTEAEFDYSNVHFTRFYTFFQNFEGALLIEYYEGRSNLWSNYFISSLLENVPIEVILHYDEWNYDLEDKLIDCLRGDKGGLKSITLPNLEKASPTALCKIDRIFTGLLHCPNVTKLDYCGFSNMGNKRIDDVIRSSHHLTELNYGILDELYTSGKALQGLFKYFTNPETTCPNLSLALKKMSITNISCNTFKIENCHLPNLEVLEINRCSIGSIKNLSMPSLLTFTINRSSMREISDLRLDSLVTFTINLSLYCPTYSIGVWDDLSDLFGAFPTRMIDLFGGFPMRMVDIDGYFRFHLKNVYVPNLERFALDKNNEHSIKIYELNISAGNIKTFEWPKILNTKTEKTDQIRELFDSF